MKTGYYPVISPTDTTFFEDPMTGTDIVFIEGLVYFEKKWFLYYGCADSRVAVAIYDPANPASPDPLP